MGICLSLCFTWGSSEAHVPLLEVGVGAGCTGSRCWGGVGGHWEPSGAGGHSCALRGHHCVWEGPFCALLGPQGSASSERSGGVWTTGKGTGIPWSRELPIPPSLLAQSRSPLTWWSRKGLAFGAKAFTTLPLHIKLRPVWVFQSSLVPAGSPRDLSFLVISPAGTS